MLKAESSPKNGLASEAPLAGRRMVRIAGLEPARLAALPPQSSVSANSTISALACVAEAHRKMICEPTFTSAQRRLGLNNEAGRSLKSKRIEVTIRTAPGVYGPRLSQAQRSANRPPTIFQHDSACRHAAAGTAAVRTVEGRVHERSRAPLCVYGDGSSHCHPRQCCGWVVLKSLPRSLPKSN